MKKDYNFNIYPSVILEIILKKSAFTLIEVIVTLTVITVVMALLIPAVNRSTPEANVLLYKKAIINLQDAIDQGADEAELNFTPYDYHSEYHFINIKPKDFCDMIADQFIVRGHVYCDVDTSDVTKKPSLHQVNGFTYWNIGGPSYETATFKDRFTGDDCTINTPAVLRENCVRTVWVDVNGEDKGKNKHGDDRYRLQIRYDGKVMIGTGDDWDTVELVAMGSRNITDEEVVHNSQNNDDDDDDVNYTKRCTKYNSPAYCTRLCNSWLFRILFFWLGYCK